jgi:ABC-type amino acid transport system permease subunit
MGTPKEVGGLEHILLSIIYGIILPIDFHIFQNIPLLYWLVVWNFWIIFPYIGNVIIPTDELIFFRGVAQPPTR